MRQLLTRLHDWWNPPCRKHPGHRQKEVDMDLAAPMSGLPDMCEECWSEFNTNLEKQWK